MPVLTVLSSRTTTNGDMEHKPQWALDHELDDNRRFAEINSKLDSILEIVSAFKLGGRGVAWTIGLLVGIGSLIVIVMKIAGK